MQAPPEACASWLTGLAPSTLYLNSLKAGTGSMQQPLPWPMPDHSGCLQEACHICQGAEGSGSVTRDQALQVGGQPGTIVHACLASLPAEEAGGEALPARSLLD